MIMANYLLLVINNNYYYLDMCRYVPIKLYQEYTLDCIHVYIALFIIVDNAQSNSGIQFSHSGIYSVIPNDYNKLPVITRKAAEPCPYVRV